MTITTKKIFNIIESNKKWLGFADYTFTVLRKQTGMDCLAEIVIDMWNKRATMKFSEAYEKEPESDQEDIVIHEILHGRIELIEEKVDYETEKIRYRLEEDFVNDIIRWKNNIMLK